MILYVFWVIEIIACLINFKNKYFFIYYINEWTFKFEMFIYVFFCITIWIDY